MDARPDPELPHTLRNVLFEQENGRLAILFGSRVIGQGKPQSDPDLAVLMSVSMEAIDKIARVEWIAKATDMPFVRGSRLSALPQPHSGRTEALTLAGNRA